MLSSIDPQASPNAIIIGAGPSGIALAHTLKQSLGFDNFILYEKLDGVGGTWRTNTYPGCGCDVPTHLYSFSFNLNPKWSKELCDREEILEYMEATVDKFDLRSNMIFETECTGAEWQPKRGQWKVKFRDCKSNIEFVRHATILVTAVGGLSVPKDVHFEGKESFKGESFHTARWNNSYDYTGKRMAIIGNGCSAAQIVPEVLKKAAYVKQYARSPQWYHDRPNHTYTGFQKWCFQYVPLWQRFLRLSIFMESDALVTTYVRGEKAEKARANVEATAKEYIYSKTPKRYHDFIVPDFPLGCKRRIFDPGYLESLHAPNVELVNEGLTKITETGIISQSGVVDEFDVIVYSTGYEVSKFLTPMEVKGVEGISLQQQWKENRGAQAYMGTFVHNFPNFAMLFGPNTFPAHGSALFNCEVQVSYLASYLFAPIIDNRTSTVEVKEAAENAFVNKIHQRLAGSVFAAGCSNWYINEFGRNVASWPGYCSSYWFLTLWPQEGNFEKSGGSKWGALRTLQRWIRTRGPITWTILALIVAVNFTSPDVRAPHFLSTLVSGLRTTLKSSALSSLTIRTK